MGVDVDAKHMYGYRVTCDEVPDFAERLDSEFDDLADEAGGYELTIFGTKLYCSDLLVDDNAWEDRPECKNWYIGLPISNEATTEELLRECQDLDDVVKRMYELVMRKPPTEEPKVFSYARWW